MKYPIFIFSFLFLALISNAQTNGKSIIEQLQNNVEVKSYNLSNGVSTIYKYKNINNCIVSELYKCDLIYSQHNGNFKEFSISLEKQDYMGVYKTKDNKRYKEKCILCKQLFFSCDTLYKKRVIKIDRNGEIEIEPYYHHYIKAKTRIFTKYKYRDSIQDPVTGKYIDSGKHGTIENTFEKRFELQEHFITEEFYNYLNDFLPSSACVRKEADEYYHERD